MQQRFLSSLGLICFASAVAFAAEPIPRVLPPAGIELPPVQENRVSLRLKEVVRRAQSSLDHELIADAGVCIKAVDFALKHGEFYQPKDVDKAMRVLQLADERLRQLSANPIPWTRQHGRVVRGFRSRIDDSFQPYGLVIPEDVDFERPVPLYVWLHGRGDKQTDLHFIHERLDQDGQIKPPGAIVLHAFGRHCLGFKSAGETDVLEAIEHVQSQYRIDPDRIVLMGFSMGGAGTWHLGAHYTDRFVAMSPGAGFAETARYQNLKPDNYPPRYEQVLWSVYDVPNYTRNLFNRPLIAYSGEQDKQIQAARIMEEAFRENGKELTHLIGPGMGHKYHPDTLKDILGRVAAAVKEGRPRTPNRVSLQTRTLRYNHMDWVEALRLDKHWEDSRIDAEIVGDRKLRVTTKNVTACKLSPWEKMAGVEIEIDGKKLTAPTDSGDSVVLQRDEKWQIAGKQNEIKLHKRHGLQGPIDDAFLDSFLVVIPASSQSVPRRSGKKKEAERRPAAEETDATRRIQEELQHFRDRWRSVFRGELRVKPDNAVTADDIAKYHLVVWGTPETNQVLKQMTVFADSFPLSWSKDEIVVGRQRFSTKNHIPVFIYPNPLNSERYVVVNSGPTFREAHDRTNSLQNPKLPDWAIVDVSQPADGKSPGKIVAADFFDESWQLPAR